jgi:hypothetical protein
VDALPCAMLSAHRPACPPAQVEAYIHALLGDVWPKAIVVCMIYYPGARSPSRWLACLRSWSPSVGCSAVRRVVGQHDPALERLRQEPRAAAGDTPTQWLLILATLTLLASQLVIRTLFEQATKAIRVEGSAVIPCPLFNVLDPADPGELHPVSSGRTPTTADVAAVGSQRTTSHGWSPARRAVGRWHWRSSRASPRRACSFCIALLHTAPSLSASFPF